MMTALATATEEARSESRVAAAPFVDSLQNRTIRGMTQRLVIEMPLQIFLQSAGRRNIDPDGSAARQRLTIAASPWDTEGLRLRIL